MHVNQHSTVGLARFVFVVATAIVALGAAGVGRGVDGDSSSALDLTPVFGDPVELFPGEGLQGWTAYYQDGDREPAAAWSMVDGRLVCAGLPVGYLQSDELYLNYQLDFDWRFDPERGPGNSGVLLRITGPDQVWPRCVEAQLHSGNAGDIWNIGAFPMSVVKSRTEGRRTRRMVDVPEKPLGEWNRYSIRLDRGSLTLKVNGRVQNVASNLAEVPGRIGLQSEGAYIEFRDFTLRPIVAWRAASDSK